MKPSFCTAMFIFAATMLIKPPSSGAQERPAFADPVFRLNHTRVSDIDPALPNIPFHQWLRFDSVSIKSEPCRSTDSRTSAASCIEIRVPLPAPALGGVIVIKALAGGAEGSDRKPEFTDIALHDGKTVIRQFKTLFELGAYFDSLERCMLLVKNFKSIPLAKDAAPPLRNENSAWLSDSRPLETGFNTHCRVGQRATVKASCFYGKGAIDIPKSVVVDSSDPTSWTIVMISKEDYDVLRPLLWRREIDASVACSGKQ